MCAWLTGKYNLPSVDFTMAVVANAIRHLPPQQAEIEHKYLADCVKKAVANGVAQHIADTMRHDAGVTDLLNQIKADPNNQQARDQLTQAAANGSSKAKDALLELAKYEGFPPA